MTTVTIRRKRKPRAPQNGTRVRVLDFVRDFIEKRGYAPTYREIREGCELGSTCTVAHHLSLLERDGYIRRGGKGAVRAIAVVEGK